MHRLGTCNFSEQTLKRCFGVMRVTRSVEEIRLTLRSKFIELGGRGGCVLQ